MSTECSKTELDLFTLPPTQTSIELGQWVQYKPLASLTDDAPLEFAIPGHGDEYIDLSHTLLSLKVRILNVNGSIVTADSNKVGPVNCLLHSLFSQVEVYLNQKLVSVSGNTYPYRAYIETLLSYGAGAKESHLSSALWITDTAEHMDATEDDNKGLKKRRAFMFNSSPIDLMGHIHSDIFHQNKYLLNGVELKLKLFRSRDEFCLMSKSPFIVNIMEASVMVRRVKINPTVLISHAKAIEQYSAKYPITRVDVKAFTIPAGVLGKSIDNVYLGQLPKRIIIGLVSNKAFNGSLKHNPYNFHHYNVNFLSMYIDGQQVPTRALQPDFNVNNLYTQCYQTLFSGSGIHFSNEGNAISREMYPHGFCLFAFDLTPDLAAGSHHWNLVRRGSLRIDVKFNLILTETINCIVYGEFDNLIEVDKYRNVIVDYN